MMPPTDLLEMRMAQAIGLLEALKTAFALTLGPKY